MYYNEGIINPGVELNRQGRGRHRQVRPGPGANKGCPILSGRGLPLFEVKNYSISLDTDQVLLGQGADPSRASPALRRIAQEVLSELKILLEPVALLGTLPILGFQGRRVFFEGGFFEGPLLARAMAGAAELGLVLCTIGPGLEERVRELRDKEPVKALALDGAGTAAVGLLSFLAAGDVAAAAEKRGLRSGVELSPGQEGWPIEQQRTFFRLLPAERIKVRLTESGMMLPRKSISLAIPLGEAVCDDAVSCDFCSKKEDCRWRRGVR